MKKVYLLIAIIIFTGLGLGPDSKAQEQKAAPTPQPETKRPGSRNLAILIFDGVQIIDYTGPYETFGHVASDDGPAFNMYTVSEKTDPITTSMGMSVNPKYSIENAPEPDVLVVPGGDVRGQVANPAVIKWVQDRAQKAEIVLSVCNGAYILAKAGLLDGLSATTTAGLIPGLRVAAPKTHVVDDQRFVDNGKIITAAGLSSGIDGALHVIERLFGKGTAEMAALGMEYNWDPESKFARAALADRYMRFDYQLKTAPGGWVPLSREGDRDQWENRWSVTTQSSAADVMNTINGTIAAGKMYDGSTLNWTPADADAHQNLMQSSWRFTDDKGGNWNGIARLDPVAGEKNHFTLSVKVARTGTSAAWPGK